MMTRTQTRGVVDMVNNKYGILHQSILRSYDASEDSISTFVNVIAGSWIGLQQTGLGRLIFLRRLVHWHLRQGICRQELRSCCEHGPCRATVHWNDNQVAGTQTLGSSLEVVSRGT